METIEVRASRCYTIVIEEGLLARAGEHCTQVLHGKKVLLLTDETVNALYGDTVERSLCEAGFEVTRLAVPVGEGSKSTAVYLQVVSFLAANGFTRSDAIVALGGGVVGDLGGFCAASYLRGIGFVQIPTTLLACVDSSVGGKTAVNLPEGKNLLGAFYQPWLVLCDPCALRTLPKAIYADGMAEVIKYGMIRDSELFALLESEKLRDAEIISRCVSIKRDVVQADERDHGCRQLLNYGHTIGHAVEKCSNFGISHGSAVAIGMAIVARAMVAMGTMAAKDCARLTALLKKHGLPTTCDFSAAALYEVALSDKKRANDMLGLIVCPTVGDGQINKIPVTALMEYIEKGTAPCK